MCFMLLSDPYAFDVVINAGKISSQTAEIFYSGVPEPEEKYVNVYRAVYVREDERVDAQTFKIPKIRSPKMIFLNELKPDIVYQVWLEAFLSNGRKKKSNVISITTRAGALPKPERSEVGELCINLFSLIFLVHSYNRMHIILPFMFSFRICCT